MNNERQQQDEVQRRIDEAKRKALDKADEWFDRQTPCVRQLDSTVMSYLKHLNRKLYTACTMSHNACSLKKLRTFALTLGRDLEDLTLADLEEFSDWMREASAQPRGKALSPKTIHGVILDAKAFYKWVSKREEWAKNPMRDVETPTLPKKILDPYTGSEYQKIEQAFTGKTPQDLRNKAIVLTFLSGGFRRCELSNLKVGDVDLDDGYITVLGKGQKWRKTPINDRAVNAIRKYLRARKWPSSDAPLWLGKRGALTYEGIGQAIADGGAKVGVKATCHRFRRTTAINMLKQGCPTQAVMAQLGHEDIQSMKPYVKFVEADVKRFNDRYDPCEFTK